MRYEFPEVPKFSPPGNLRSNHLNEQIRSYTDSLLEENPELTNDSDRDSHSHFESRTSTFLIHIAIRVVRSKIG